MRIEVNDAGEILYYPTDPNLPPQILTEKDDLCGLSFFNTGPNDPFRLCCAWHDRAYTSRAFFEQHGWTRMKIDRYFFDLMMQTANGDFGLIVRAKSYYAMVRAIGWLPYYRHVGYDGKEKIDDDEKVLAFLNDLNKDTFVA